MKQLLCLFLAPFVLAANAQQASGPADPASSPPRHAETSPESVCSNYREVMGSIEYPRAATAMDITDGSVVVRFTLSADNEVAEVAVRRMSHPMFAEVAVVAVKRLRCNGHGKRLRIQVPFAFKLED